MYQGQRMEIEQRRTQNLKNICTLVEVEGDQEEPPGLAVKWGRSITQPWPKYLRKMKPSGRLRGDSTIVIILGEESVPEEQCNSLGRNIGGTGQNNNCSIFPCVTPKVILRSNPFFQVWTPQFTHYKWKEQTHFTFRYNLNHDLDLQGHCHKS